MLSTKQFQRTAVEFTCKLPEVPTKEDIRDKYGYDMNNSGLQFLNLDINEGMEFLSLMNGSKFPTSVSVEFLNPPKFDKLYLGKDDNYHISENGRVTICGSYVDETNVDPIPLKHNYCLYCLDEGEYMEIKKFQKCILDDMKEYIDECEENNEEIEWLCELDENPNFVHIYLCSDARSHISIDGLKGLCGKEVTCRENKVYGEKWYCDKCIMAKV